MKIFLCGSPTITSGKLVRQTIIGFAHCVVHIPTRPAGACPLAIKACREVDIKTIVVTPPLGELTQSLEIINDCEIAYFILTHPFAKDDPFSERLIEQAYNSGIKTRIISERVKGSYVKC